MEVLGVLETQRPEIGLWDRFQPADYIKTCSGMSPRKAAVAYVCLNRCACRLWDSSFQS